MKCDEFYEKHVKGGKALPKEPPAQVQTDTGARILMGMAVGNTTASMIENGIFVNGTKYVFKGEADNQPLNLSRLAGWQLTLTQQNMQSV
jgi:hypothetical protein